MREAISYICWVCSFPISLLGVILLSVAAIGVNPIKFLHPLILLVLLSFVNIDSIAMYDGVNLKGDTKLTCSLPFSRDSLWTARELIVLPMYLIPGLVCILSDYSEPVLLCAELLVMAVSAFTAASCLRNSLWILFGGLIEICVFIFYMMLEKRVLFSRIRFKEYFLTSQPLRISAGAILIIIVASILLRWRLERKLFTKGYLK